MPVLTVPTAPANQPVKKVALLFAGGPAPAANAVISSCAAAFLRQGLEVIGIRHGYSSLIDYTADKPLVEGEHYITIDDAFIKRARASQGIVIGTARANPGKSISHPDHFQDKERVAALHRVYEGLASLGVDALVSIGGDDTLKTANKFSMYQDRLPEGHRPIRVVHVPKTIDNDYFGIDFTFGFFTAVDFMATEIRNLMYDAEAARAYFLVESMGRSAGWLAYGAAIAGEASIVISVEDIVGEYEDRETVTLEDGSTKTRKIMNFDKVVQRITDMMIARERDGKEYGVIVVAEGIAEFLPAKQLEGIPRDEHGHIAISQVAVARLLADLITKAYEAIPEGTRRRKTRKINPVQLGYETRCSQPTAFDVMLGSQLGVGAYRALVEEGKTGVMISVEKQLSLAYVPFEELVDQSTLVTRVRYILPESDYHMLARYLESDVR